MTHQRGTSLKQTDSIAWFSDLQKDCVFYYKTENLKILLWKKYWLAIKYSCLV